MNLAHRLTAGLFVLSMPTLVVGADMTVDPDTGARTWTASAHGVALSLTQLLPDQLRAFYLNRGFPAEAAEVYATSCAYMTVLRNDAAPGALTFRLADWSISAQSAARPPRPVDDWLTEWRRRGLAEAAVIAFRWAQFPPEQEYEPGDWNQGMLSVGMPAGAEFDLIARWQAAGQTFEGKLTDVRCAP